MEMSALMSELKEGTIPPPPQGEGLRSKDRNRRTVAEGFLGTGADHINEEAGSAQASITLQRRRLNPRPPEWMSHFGGAECSLGGFGLR